MDTCEPIESMEAGASALMQKLNIKRLPPLYFSLLSEHPHGEPRFEEKLELGSYSCQSLFKSLD